MSQRPTPETDAAILASSGQSGWWRVSGLRHSAIARASSAHEAVEKTLNAGLIGDWEDPEADFWTEELPDVFS